MSAECDHRWEDVASVGGDKIGERCARCGDKRGPVCAFCHRKPVHRYNALCPRCMFVVRPCARCGATFKRRRMYLPREKTQCCASCRHKRSAA